MRKNVRSYEKGHPNPLFYRPSWLSLNGEWKLVFDDADQGLGAGYHAAMPSFAIPINVPYAYETPLSGVKEKQEHGIIWYFRSFAKPKWLNRTLLHFERCDYVFDGWLNGKYLGRHIGGYDAFSFDIADYLNEGDNLLSIRVYDAKDPKQVRGSQPYEGGPASSFPLITGLYGPVWLEEVDAERLKGYDARGSYEEKAFYLRLLFTHRARGASALIHLSYRGKKVAEASFPITGTFLEANLPIPAKLFHAWSPAAPCLYDLVIEVVREGLVKDRIYSYCGVNEVSQSKRFLAINGRKRYLRLASYEGQSEEGGPTLTEEEYARDIALLKALGFNGVRIHEKIESELFYYLADREGLFTDVEMPSCHGYDPAAAKKAGDQFGIFVRDHVGHPSVIAYVAYEESKGIPEVASDEAQQAQATSLYEMANRIDWTRPVISNDGYEHTKSDLLTIHNYAADEKAMAAYRKPYLLALGNNANFKVDGLHLAFAGAAHYDGQPLIMSAFFGAPIGRGKKGHAPSAPSVRAYLKRYRGLLRELKKMGCAGYCATEFADVYGMEDGFVTADRKPKASPEAVRRANKAF